MIRLQSILAFEIFAVIIVIISGCATEQSNVSFNKSNSDLLTEKYDVLLNQNGKLEELFNFQKKLFPDARRLPTTNDLNKSWSASRLLSAGEVGYPEWLRLASQEGRVDVAVLINEDGKVADSKIYRSTNKNFNDVAIQAVKRWKYAPARLNDVPYQSVLVLPVKFQLDPVANGDPNTEVVCQIISYGIMDGITLEKTHDPDSATGTSLGMLYLAVTEQTDIIPKSVGVRFGFEFTVTNLMAGNKLELVTKHPAITSLDGKQKTLTRSFIPEGSSAVAYTIEAEYEAKPGLWELSINNEGTQLCSKSFTLH